MASLATLLTDPDAFFADRRSLGLAGPLVVVGVLAGLGLLRTVVAVLAAPGPAVGSGPAAGQPAPRSGDLWLLGDLGPGVAVLASLVGPVVWWLLFGGLFVRLSDALGETEGGDVEAVLAVAGWGLVPRAVAVAVSLLAALGGVAVGGGPAVVGPIGTLTTLVAVATTLWSGYVWTRGLAVVRDMGVGRAALTVAPVVVGGVLAAVVRFA